MDSNRLVYIKKFVWLPYGQKMIQVFCLEQGAIRKAICYNEFLNKSFEILDLADIRISDSSENFPSNSEEFLRFENYL
ncbi:hypothetical protein ND861_10900 [Leptospira sp. 2 VSF19]|uniref:WYL domain protein n=1 Tax=Leptospira soteropolitanensis TaxID=2950025 RepID=A0AAW5VG17_9LEPT|nr:hypothetical protein [Leptospira soteropolitanensis]MCW7493190.1 hypothetical protein [Leptospira soteropolitanensis]MCW7500741.1 hypothetical protein [Leptospira soteropolitanensis]MCW7523040.1 hypothetical protein [Leptospira soteropolitanensis]MCW7526853.1 hypothetical protein [Leptospira soteropolitanensis]MCW7530758.1 hypothetical protein [Leptospira soteropolitanensis]